MMATSSAAGISTPNLKKIQDLQCGQKLVNLLGVVTSFRPPSKSRGKDYSCYLELVDESENPVKCLLFGSESSLPQRCAVGSVVCLKKIEVVDFNGHPQLLAHSKLSYWAILVERSNGSLTVSASNDSLVSLSETEKQRGRTLKVWVEQTNLIPAPSSSSSPLLPIGGRVCPPTSTRHYTVKLRNISQLTLGMRNTGVCGLVKYYKPPAESRGRDSYTVVHIIDESSPSIGLTCLIFNPSKEKLAVMGSVGAVAIIKGVRIETQKDTGCLQALGHEHTLVGVFSGAVSDVTPNRIGSWYDLDSNEVTRIEELRLWSKREGPLLLSSKLEEVTTGHYFNMVCQVAAMAVLEKRKNAVLSVLDGTTAKIPFRELDLSMTKQLWDFDSDPELFYSHRLLTHDVWVTNIAQLDVAAGDIVHMINVFSYQHPPRHSVQATSTVEPQVELKLVDRKGNIIHLEEGCQDALKLKESLPVMHGVFPSWRAPEQSDLDESDESDTVLTIVDDSTPQGTLEEIKRADTGSEHVAEVEILQVRPGTVNAMCVPFCPKCNGKGLEVQAKNSKDSKCLKDKTILEYKLNFSLLLCDETDELEVLVDSRESQRLLSKTFTVKLIADQETKEKILDIFYVLTGGNDPFFALPSDPRYSYPRPTFQCAIKKIDLAPTESAGEHSYNYYLVNTVIDQR